MVGSRIAADLWLSDYITSWDIYAHGVIRVLLSQQTAYQKMEILETVSYGRVLVLDGKLQSCMVDEFLYHEPLVQPALIYHGKPQKVLILGGGEGATVREVLRWHTVKEVVMVDLDQEVVAACKNYLPEMSDRAFDDPRTTVNIDNAINFLDNSSQQWDVIISDLSDPVESGPSFQLFTQEYFSKMARVLKPDGFLVVQAGSTALAGLRFHTKVAHTINQVFPHIQSYSSDVPSFGEPWGFVLASKQPISSRPDPESVNQLLATQTKGGLRMLDGNTLLGLFQIPTYLRNAIASETEVYTLANPPQNHSINNWG
ncbi:methyltransferase domain-containing protein [Limnospira fusiformis KN01]|uniref:Polyamine aminopropyltransferase n=3 Tax=Limnospira TaxID=2596745 RepID=A0A9P1KJC9_9CYAN|nr:MULTISPECIES: methyltransferase domain-containing protein [Limnospira]AMW29804.1 spermidine synthase [Arthrospira platensis YZ]MBD2669488.1 methyltransferase domain-containing protein [Arthrospira platensis FACHB-439]MDC0837686.1 methyltransferase domain-containing protein [Limnoraphis robusta]MDY7054323.1 methyltransferase domain-containing protein [Limnospira fusiformis LS22]QJB24983.1 methyltransferase domain-containing protein [Limnospira fusiformis SAG 85.79]